MRKRSNDNPVRGVRPNSAAASGGSRRRQNAGRIRFWPAFLVLAIALVLIVSQLVFGSHFSWPKIFGFAPDLTTAKTTPGGSPGSQMISSTAPDGTLSPTVPIPSPSPTTVPETRITLAAVGDIILHQAVIDGGLVSGKPQTAKYDYTPIFQYVRPILQAADLGLANYEGTLAGPPYSGYPFFCAPDAIADALADAGIKVAWTANNHTIDKGLKGVVRTAQVFLDKGFQVIGTRPDETKPADAVIDVEGIKIGLMAYTFETTGSASQKALNGIAMPEAADPLIDSFNPYRAESLARDMKAMLKRVAALREQGAEIICLSLHWGNEYQTRSGSYQRQMAQQLSDAGVELIIGHHPHVLQEIDVLTSKTTGKPTLVYYSIGNFLANMDYNTHDTAGKAQDAVIARITLHKGSSGVNIELGEYVPTHVVRVPKGSGLQHLIVPVLPALADPAAYQTTQKEMQAAATRISAILGQSQGNEILTVKQTER